MNLWCEFHLGFEMPITCTGKATYPDTIDQETNHLKI